MPNKFNDPGRRIKLPPLATGARSKVIVTGASVMIVMPSFAKCKNSIDPKVSAVVGSCKISIAPHMIHIVAGGADPDTDYRRNYNYVHYCCYPAQNQP